MNSRLIVSEHYEVEVRGLHEFSRGFIAEGAPNPSGGLEELT